MGLIRKFCPHLSFRPTLDQHLNLGALRLFEIVFGMDGCEVVIQHGEVVRNAVISPVM
jgi:hypothetical protein